MVSFVGEARSHRPSPVPGSDPAEIYDFLSRKSNVRYVARELGGFIAEHFTDCHWLVGTARAHYLLPPVVREVRRANHHRIEARRAWPGDRGKAVIEGGINCDEASVVILALQTGDRHRGQAGDIIRALPPGCISGIVAVRSIGPVERADPPIYSMYQSPLALQTGLRYNGKPVPMSAPDIPPINPFAKTLLEYLNTPDAPSEVARHVGSMLEGIFPECKTVVTTSNANPLALSLRKYDIGIKGPYYGRLQPDVISPDGVVILDAYCGDRTDAVAAKASELSGLGIQAIGSISARIVDHPGCSPTIHDYIASRL